MDLWQSWSFLGVPKPHLENHCSNWTLALPRALPWDPLRWWWFFSPTHLVSLDCEGECLLSLLLVPLWDHSSSLKKSPSNYQTILLTSPSCDHHRRLLVIPIFLWSFNSWFLIITLGDFNICIERIWSHILAAQFLDSGFNDLVLCSTSATLSLMVSLDLVTSYCHPLPLSDFPVHPLQYPDSRNSSTPWDAPFYGLSFSSCPPFPPHPD